MIRPDPYVDLVCRDPFVDFFVRDYAPPMREITLEALESAAAEAELGGKALEVSADIMAEILLLHADQTPYLDGVLFSCDKELEADTVNVV